MTPGAVERLRAAPAVTQVRIERVVAILRRVDPGRLDAVVDALVAGGVRIVEITLDSDDAPGAIARLARRGDILVAAGTVRTPADVDAAVDAGAALCIGPATRPAVVERCLARGVPAIPGAMTPSEVEEAWALGASLVKLFPAGTLGPGYVRDLRGPLRDVPLLATGGVDAANAAAFLAAGAVAVGVGSALVQGEPADVERAARALSSAARGG